MDAMMVMGITLMVLVLGMVIAGVVMLVDYLKRRQIKMVSDIIIDRYVPAVMNETKKMMTDGVTGMFEDIMKMQKKVMEEDY